ncbi:MAG: hypothetical protein WCG27_12655 [Pseudomonadota bacterium]
MRDASMDNDSTKTKTRREKFTKGCEAGHPNCCMRLAFQEKYLNNFEAAKKYFKLACGKGDFDSCRHLGNVLLNEEKNPQGAIESFQIGCKKGDNISCSTISTLTSSSYKADFGIEIREEAVAIGDHIIIRDQPSLKKWKHLGYINKTMVINVLEKGKSEAEVEGKIYTWYKVKIGGLEGWCTDHFLRLKQ